MARVLVIDDDADTRLFVRTVLEHAGHTVAEAADGREGTTKALATRPDLILLDLALASMSGPRVARALRADARTASTKIALYTATPMNPALRDFMAAYAVVRVVPKPADPKEFLAAVQRALAG